MRGLLATTIALAVLVSLAAPANAQQQQQQQRQTAQPASWTGSQVGGFGGVSTLGGNFTEPGAQFCSFGFAATCPEVPFSFSGGSPTVATGGVFAATASLGAARLSALRPILPPSTAALPASKPTPMLQPAG